MVTRSVLKMVHSAYVGGFMQAGDFVTIAEVSSYLHSDTITAHGGFGSPPSRPLITAAQATCPLDCNVASSRDHKNPQVAPPSCSSSARSELCDDLSLSF